MTEEQRQALLRAARFSMRPLGHKSPVWPMAEGVVWLHGTIRLASSVEVVDDDWERAQRHLEYAAIHTLEVVRDAVAELPWPEEVSDARSVEPGHQSEPLPFWLFGWWEYEAGGGYRDLQGRYATLAEAQAAHSMYDGGIVDVRTGELWGWLDRHDGWKAYGSIWEDVSDG